MKETSVLLTVAALAFAVYGFGIQANSQSRAQTPTANQQQASPDDNASKSMGEKSFTGTIMKSGDMFVLQDAASDTSYQLDDQAKAKHYQNKQVKVKGTLDAATGTIKVASIEAGS
jgi:hypothetical protein